MKYSKKSPQLLREQKLCNERDRARRARDQAMQFASQKEAELHSSEAELAKSIRNNQLVRATKWACPEGEYTDIRISIRVPKERWLHPEHAQMAMAEALNQLGYGIGQEMRKISLHALKSAMTKPSQEMCRAKRDFMMNLRPDQMWGITFEAVDKMWEVCLNAILAEAMSK